MIPFYHPILQQLSFSPSRKEKYINKAHSGISAIRVSLWLKYKVRSLLALTTYTHPFNPPPPYHSSLSTYNFAASVPTLFSFICRRYRSFQVSKCQDNTAHPMLWKVGITVSRTYWEDLTPILKMYYCV